MKQFLWMVAGALVAAAVGSAVGQSQTTPNVIPGCIYNSVPPTLADRQQAVLQCDANGNLRVTGS